MSSSEEETPIDGLLEEVIRGLEEIELHMASNWEKTREFVIGTQD